MNTPTHPVLSDKEAIDKLEKLKARQAALENQRTRLETQLESAAKEYDRLSAEALANFQTTDLTVLREKQLTMQQENSVAVLNFEAALDAYELALKEINAKLAT